MSCPSEKPHDTSTESGSTGLPKPTRQERRQALFDAAPDMDYEAFAQALWDVRSFGDDAKRLQKGALESAVRAGTLDFSNPIVQ